MPSIFFCQQEIGTAVRSFERQIVIVGNSKSVKTHHFCAQLFLCYNIYLPRTPRGSQSGREKRRNESFQVRPKESWVPTLTELFSKIQADAGS